jgi:hypothetical protein
VRQLGIDALGLAGLGMFGAGVHMLSPAAALALVGLIVLGVAVALTLARPE